MQSTEDNSVKKQNGAVETAETEHLDSNPCHLDDLLYLAWSVFPYVKYK